MQLNFTNLFNFDNEVIEIDTRISLDDFEYSTYKPLKNGAEVKGRAYCKADVVYLDLSISFDFFGVCDRCAEDFERNYSFNINKIVVQKLENEDDDFDDFVIVENNLFDLDDYVYQEIQLYLPQKMLCSEDCKGLCPKCGKNLNKGKCSCEKEVDPRMAALLQLLDQE
ncbi:MAG: DUF177 domain-containing protein [Ruminococcaceae bacterium]|nr:DUF177 domain-containing protein [Oscillospiraceae bacterium]